LGRIPAQAGSCRANAIVLLFVPAAGLISMSSLRLGGGDAGLRLAPAEKAKCLAKIRITCYIILIRRSGRSAGPEKLRREKVLFGFARNPLKSPNSDE
jgi:hypothetical protein